MRKIIATALLASPLLALAAPTNLLINGSFEDTAMSTNAWSNFSGVSGWTAGAAGVEVRNNVAGTALDGSRFVELDTYANSSISQTISTVAGQWYSLSFAYSNRIDTAVSTNGLSWSFGSASGTAAVQAQISGDNHWQLFSTQVQAQGSSMTLSFAATGTSDGLGTSLDKVSVSAVPEPQSYALMLAGLAAVGFVAMRRKIK